MTYCSSQHGPFASLDHTDSPVSLLRDDLNSATAFLGAIVSIVLYPYLLWCLLLIALQHLRVRRYRIEGDPGASEPDPCRAGDSRGRFTREIRAPVA